LFNFFRHYRSPPFHTVIRIHLISLSYHILVILPSDFSSMEQMLMLIICFLQRVLTTVRRRPGWRVKKVGKNNYHLTVRFIFHCITIKLSYTTNENTRHSYHLYAQKKFKKFASTWIFQRHVLDPQVRILGEDGLLIVVSWESTYPLS